MRIVVVFLVLALALALPFVIWGDTLAERLSVSGAAEWLREQGQWAWAFGCALLVGDLVLPLPSTAVMSALGAVYGTWIGGAISAAGSTLSGLLGYALCRALGRGAAERIAGPKDLARAEVWFRSSGGWIVAFSRWLPLLPEVVCCMAGLTRMPVRTLIVALLCGSIPIGIVYAAIGATGIERPALAIGLSAGLPIVLWPLAQWILGRGKPREDGSTAGKQEKERTAGKKREERTAGKKREESTAGKR
ncbi:MAG TPA: VTT domain-containing protein, partial [Planctomycetota bacterium]|nr:VTT domain-containing protein [Planctomycetota bacterium]